MGDLARQKLARIAEKSLRRRLITKSFAVVVTPFLKLKPKKIADAGNATTTTYPTVTTNDAILVTGCGKEQYKLSDGQTVSCLEISQAACGWSFSRCDDGNVYTCQNDFTQE
jgi:hypothetical protein